MIEYIKMAFEGIKLNKMRSFLTMLGIIIGISSVITIQTLGDGLKKSVNDGLATFGTNQMYVLVGAREGWNWSDLRDKDTFSLDDLQMMKERFQEIEAIGVFGGSQTATVKHGRKKAQLSLSYCTPGAEKTSNLNIVAGKFFDENDNISGKSVCVVDKEMLEDLYKIDPDKALGMEIQCETPDKNFYNYTIVGVYKTNKIDNPLIYMNDTGQSTAYIPLFTGLRQYAPHYSPDEFKTTNFELKSYDGMDSSKLKKNIISYYEKNGFGEEDRAKMEIYSLDEQKKEIDNIMMNVTLVISIIAAISLIVGGIGVMNILLVSVTERTREIGIRKALGATNKDIRMQFIIESIILCGVGGSIGVLLGAILGYLGSVVIETPNLPSLGTIIVAVGFSMFIGIFFGYYPANRAAKLNPIDALRYE